MDRLQGTDDWKHTIRSKKKCSKQFRCECSSCSLNFNPETPRLHSGAECDGLETTKTAKLPPIPEVVWQQPPDSSLNRHTVIKNNNDSSIRNTQETQMANVASQTSPPKVIKPQSNVTATEQPPRKSNME